VEALVMDRLMKEEQRGEFESSDAVSQYGRGNVLILNAHLNLHSGVQQSYEAIQ
jgi:hypothetical protein